jgi:hypothetical protein
MIKKKRVLEDYDRIVVTKCGNFFVFYMRTYSRTRERTLFFVVIKNIIIIKIMVEEKVVLKLHAKHVT